MGGTPRTCPGRPAALRAVPGGMVYYLRVDDQVALVAEHDLSGRCTTWSLLCWPSARRHIEPLAAQSAGVRLVYIFQARGRLEWCLPQEPPIGAEGGSISITALAVQICVVCASGRDGGGAGPAATAGPRDDSAGQPARRGAPVIPLTCVTPGPGFDPGCLEQAGERFAAGSRGTGYRSMMRGAAI